MTADCYAPLRALFTDAGYAFVEPPIVHDASVFVELAGEDLRRRLFLTSAADGTEMALRPDYTIPVCLHHLAAGTSRGAANYAYLGPVFRQRPGENGEFLQAGVESLGRSNRIAADADILALALQAATVLGVARPAVRIGDAALFAAVLDALRIDTPWRRRLARTFGEPGRLKALVKKATKPAAAPAHVRADRRRALASAREILSRTGLATIDGRTAAEIADRMVEKAALSVGIGSDAGAILTRFLAIKGQPQTALAALRDLAASESRGIGAAVDRFEQRLDAFAKRDIDADRLRFAADFGRRLDYYTGFVFEIHDPRRRDQRQLIGGGRYDRLIAMIGHGRSIPAVGFAIWLDRIGEAL